MRTFLFTFLLVVVVGAPLADTVSVTWVAPTQRVDGSPLPAAEIAGYSIAWSVKGAAQAPIRVGPITNFTLDTEALSGRTCVSLVTIDTDGLESDPTGPVCRNSRPNPPSNVRAK